MTQVITAIYADGMLKPDVQPNLPAGARVRLIVQPLDSPTDRQQASDELDQLCADFPVDSGGERLAQPAVKCRGREYLRIIYGPDYTTEENLGRLRNRGLGQKRSLALGEFALGIEGLERFVRREPLRRVHERVFGVLALESEPVDPGL
jgi:predicted DNA-binding antitoxin AbrB/MazE fold protein